MPTVWSRRSPAPQGAYPELSRLRRIRSSGRNVAVGERGVDALVERETEVSALLATVDGARAGTGTTAVILGPPGIGKSSLLQTLAGASLRARGGELEQEFPYGVIRQLFEAPLRNLSEDARASVLSGPARPVAGLLL